MNKLREQGLVEPLRQAVAMGVPYLGICLGMQFLFERSDEMGNHEGLNLLPGYVTRFPPEINLKIPHMGWNQLHPERTSPLLENVPETSYAYFVHSYHCVPQNPDDVLITTHYGIPFAAAVQNENIFGVQFHPEKSQSVGLTILNNFLKIREKV